MSILLMAAQQAHHTLLMLPNGLQHAGGLRPMVPVAPTGTADPGNGGSLDFRNVKPSDGGIGKLDVFKTIAAIILFVGYGAGFLAFVAGLVVYGFGNRFLGQHALVAAKQDILRAGCIAMVLGVAGTMWFWLQS